MEAALQAFLLDDLNLNEIVANVIQLAYPIEEEEVVERLVPPVRNEQYYEETVPRYSPDDFRKHFRMSRNCMELLCVDIGARLQSACRDVPLQKKVMVCVWVPAEQESFLSVGDRFGIAPSTAHFVYEEVVQCLHMAMDDYIKWPTEAKALESVNVFQLRSRGIPGVVGAIDGCHIPIQQPAGNPIDFYNRKGFHSIILQGVCDDGMRFIDIAVGMPGRMHDARVFENSPLRQKLVVERVLGPDRHLIGDAAYPLLGCLITPFRNTGHLTNAQVVFNTRLSTIRSVVERAFGLLKGKFRRLKYLNMGNRGLLNRSVAACCVLHNFLLQTEGEEEMAQDYDEAYEEPEGDADVREGGNQEGRVKREYIMGLL
ncbi:putative nuclease HARBI1 [Ischnura elegans]|uniref:putative nuclease HARBI1 n=2 Tax=Ischnura elegans TaxID=197161 RepID=UPI001ED86E83|nr:putative nuclease HARBI1 [Ischnura elegans]